MSSTFLQSAIKRTSQWPISYKPETIGEQRDPIRFTKRIKRRTACVADHAAVRDAIDARDHDAARAAMRHLIDDLIDLIEDADRLRDRLWWPSRGRPRVCAIR